MNDPRRRNKIEACFDKRRPITKQLLNIPARTNNANGGGSRLNDKGVS